MSIGAPVMFEHRSYYKSECRCRTASGWGKALVHFLATQERRREAIGRLQALRDQLPPAEITEGEMQEIVNTVREVRAQNRAERERAGRS